MQKTERLLAITLLLQARGKMTAGRLATILGVSTRTIYRDIMSLSLAHVPVSMDIGPGGGYYLPDDYHLESAIFTREEAISLILSADMSGNYNLFAGDDDLQRALIKLEAALPEEYRSDVQAAREHIFLDTSEWYNRSMPSTHLEIIRAAVLGKLQIEILYPNQTCADHAGEGMQWLHIEPYGLVLKGISRRHVRTGVWYLVAFCQSCQGFHTFRVSYIEQLHVCAEQITDHPNFNLRSYWLQERAHLEQYQQPLVITLSINPAIRHSLQGNSHILCEEHDGHVIVRVEVESFDEAVSYVLALGADATVLNPCQVRKAVATTAHMIAEMYS